MILNIQIN